MGCGAPRRPGGARNRRASLSVKHLLVTNDFPPKVGGIQSYLWELWRRLPPDEVTVLTTSYEGAEAWDREQPYRIERVHAKVLLPIPGVARRIDALADATDSPLVLLDPALPLGLVGSRLHHSYGVVLHGAEITVRYHRNYPVTVNHAQETEFAAVAAEAVAGVGRVSRDMPATLGGEDFAFMLNEVPGAMINIGNGESANLHHPAYDFNDEAIAWGCSYWCEIVRQRLPL